MERGPAVQRRLHLRFDVTFQIEIKFDYPITGNKKMLPHFGSYKLP